MSIPGFLTARLAGTIASGVALLMAGALAWVVISKNATISSLEQRIEQLDRDLVAARRDLTQCRANRITLEASLQRQNAAIDAAMAEGAARLEALDRTAVAARRDAAAATARANRILARPATGDQCADAEAAIEEAIR